MVFNKAIRRLIFLFLIVILTGCTNFKRGKSQLQISNESGNMMGVVTMLNKVYPSIVGMPGEALIITCDQYRLLNDFNQLKNCIQELKRRSIALPEFKLDVSHVAEIKTLNLSRNESLSPLEALYASKANREFYVNARKSSEVNALRKLYYGSTPWMNKPSYETYYSYLKAIYALQLGRPGELVKWYRKLGFSTFPIYLSGSNYIPVMALIAAGHHDEARLIVGNIDQMISQVKISCKEQAENLSTKYYSFKEAFILCRKLSFSAERMISMAKVYSALGDLKSASKSLQAYNRAYGTWIQSKRSKELIGLKGLSEELQGDHEAVRTALLAINARSLFLKNNWKEAASAYDKLFAVSYFQTKTSEYWSALHDRSKISARLGENNKSKEYLIKAISLIEGQRAGIKHDMDKIVFSGNSDAIYGDLVEAYLDEAQPQKAFETVERAKARALVDLLAERGSFGDTSPNNSNDLTILREVKRLESESLLLVAANDASASARKRSLKKAQQNLQFTNPELASLITVDSFPVADIQSHLDSDEVLMEFYLQDNNLIAFVVTRNSVDAFKLNGKGLVEATAQLRQTVQAFKSDEYRSTTRAMYDRLIRPLAVKLKGKRLTIVPHGPLHYLPFAALNNGQKYLIETFNLRYLPSASVLKFLDKKGRPAQGLLAFGNPDLGDRKYDLPGAEEETRVIDRVWKGSRILLRKFASEANFKKFASDYKYLHLASHGQFNPKEPLKSRMLLAPGDGEDGNLTVDELYNLRLNADMVTLSACETALGDIKSGDDVIGLTRGFLYAGAKSIVASLWPVSDKATAYLMKRFYIELKKRPRSAALRTAQLATKKKFPHPIFWAAFQLTGATN